MYADDEPAEINQLTGCPICSGVVVHEGWCFVSWRHVAASVRVVPKVSIEDELILHALGVAWEEEKKGGDQ